MSKIPSNLYYSKSHEWVKQEGDYLTIGITDHAQSLLGDMVYIELPEIGREIQSGDEFAVVESVKAAADVYAPISGTVIEVNQDASADPALLNQDPYEAAWLIKIKPTGNAELSSLLSPAQYETLLVEEQ